MKKTLQIKGVLFLVAQGYKKVNSSKNGRFRSEMKRRNLTRNGIVTGSSSSIPEQPWPSGNAIDADQRGPGFEAHRRPLL